MHKIPKSYSIKDSKGVWTGVWIVLEDWVMSIEQYLSKSMKNNCFSFLRLFHGKYRRYDVETMRMCVRSQTRAK